MAMKKENMESLLKSLQRIDNLVILCEVSRFRILSKLLSLPNPRYRLSNAAFYLEWYPQLV